MIVRLAPNRIVESAWRGAAFDCCRTHRMIARKAFALPNVVQQAALENVSTRALPEPCPIVPIG
jgi:hypothetical protein